MEEQAILEQLLAILEQNGIKVRTEPIGLVPAGLCKIKGKTVFFVDKNAEAAEVAAICARAVLETIDIQNIYLKPQIREFLEKNRSVNGP
jgi:hypothetical protein